MCSIDPTQPKDYMVVNAFHQGNVARFANHRCGTYNMMSQPVYRASHSDKHFYLALVTRRTVIAGLRSLTWDYGYDDKDLKRFKCNCQTPTCPNKD